MNQANNFFEFLVEDGGRLDFCCAYMNT